MLSPPSRYTNRILHFTRACTSKGGSASNHTPYIFWHCCSISICAWQYADSLCCKHWLSVSISSWHFTGAAAGAPPEWTCSTWRGPITESMARWPIPIPAPVAIPDTTEPMRPPNMPPPPPCWAGAGAGGGGGAGGGADRPDERPPPPRGMTYDRKVLLSLEL